MSDTLTALITDTFGGDTIAILLNKYGHRIQVTEEMLKAAAKEEKQIPWPYFVAHSAISLQSQGKSWKLLQARKTRKVMANRPPYIRSYGRKAEQVTKPFGVWI